VKAALWVLLLQQEPLRLHPDNPRYFQWRGKPAVLVTSGEHYGAVLNLDFDYKAYLETLEADGLNHTRTWAGAYREVPGNFGITDNTLAPAKGRFICPWARSDQPGESDGGNKFDLSKWDEAYFARLKDFMAEASRRGVVVELNLFCPMYEEGMWKACPLNAANNVNGVGKCPRTEPLTLKHPDLLQVQEALVRKLAAELKDFDNLFYEICNEPYFGGVTMEWQHKIVDILVDAEKGFPSKHLISMNIANGSARIDKPHPAVSIFNFHYAVPPAAVAINYGLNKAIGENETGFRGKADVTYRTEGWDFILAGGALYNNLDYSFTAKHPRGTFLEYKSPGGGSPALRRQLRILKEFIHSFDIVRMAPDTKVVRSGVPDGWSARALSEPGKACALYLHRLPTASNFSARWTGLVEPRHSETYTFHTLADDGVRLWVNGQKIIDQWKDRDAKEDKGTVDLKAGEKVEIKVEYYQGTGGAQMKLSWSSPSQKREIVPRSKLHLADGSSTGLKAEYFEGRDLARPVLTRTDGTVNFDWSNTPPFAREERPVRIELVLALPDGRWRAEWVNPKTGAVDKAEEVDGGERTLASPDVTEDAALRVIGR
jgi:hypothetical protein